MVIEREIPLLTDAHIHLRQDGLTDRIAKYTGQVCGHVIAMPNTKPPIHSPELINFYRYKYQEAVGLDCKVHMTAKLLPRTTREDVRLAHKAGAIGFKLYPQGATTNSDDGIPFEHINNGVAAYLVDVFDQMEELDMVLMCHGEAPGFVMDREANFLNSFKHIASCWPKLRITLEHITTVEGLECVKDLKKANHRVLGTITVHHMMRTLDNVIGGKLNPDEFCMPIPKRPDDQLALLNAARSGDEEFALGSDSAPHEPHTKYCAGGCAGVFSAPVMAQTLVELFTYSVEYEPGRFDLPIFHRNAFEDFCINNANKFYGFKKSEKTFVVRKENNAVKCQYGGIVPFRNGEILEWKLND